MSQAFAGFMINQFTGELLSSTLASDTEEDCDVLRARWLLAFIQLVVLHYFLDIMAALAFFNCIVDRIVSGRPRNITSIVK